MESPRAPLTAVERKVWHYLLDHVSTHTYQPSVREIARQFRIPSTRTVTELLASLARKGYVRRTPGRSRGVVLEGFTGGAGSVPVPVMRIADRQLVSDGHLTLDRSLVAADDAYLLRADREDAPRHQLREGDLVLVLPTTRVPDETPVAARVGNGVVVRTLVRRGAALQLLAPAPGARDIELAESDDFAILGPIGLVLRTLVAPQDAAQGGEPG